MTLHSATLGLASVMAAPRRCPACGDTGLAPVVDVERTNFLCRVCGQCWRVELGWIARVDPESCVECAHLGECLTRAASRA